MKFFIHLFFLLKLIIFSLILGQGANIQILPHKKLDEYKKVQFFKTIKIQARRGRIYDRKGKELAINEPTYSLFADPENIKSARWTAKMISKHLGLNAKYLEKKMQKRVRFVWLKRRVDLHVRDKIKSLNISGLYFVSEPNRRYPGKDISSAVLGFVGSEGKGLEGLEYHYNDVLTGKDVELQISRDAKGRPLSIDPEQYTNPPEGQDLLLTLDSEYQRFLEIQLKNVYEKHEAKRTFGLIIDTQSGAVRAAAQWPVHDANRALFNKNSKKNILFQEAYEQGSTIKPLAIAAAIETKAFSPKSEFECLGGKVKIGRRIISDSKKMKCDSMTLTEGLKVSSNVVLTQMALKLGEEKLRPFYNSLGFGEKTLIDFPGESKGIYKKNKWSKHLLASASFGHGFTATPIQVASAYVALANDGVWLQPYMVEKVVSPTGLTHKIHRESHRVMSIESARTVRAMLTEVTQAGGTGVSAAVEGYLVAGKTGTANKVNLVSGGYYQDKYLSSFVGMIPAEKPRFVIYIGVDEPQNKHYASEVAAPAFSKVAQFILTKENIVPINLIAEKNLGCESAGCKYNPVTKSGVENLYGLTLREALRVLKDKPLKARFQGQGLVSKVTFESGKNLNDSSVIYIKLD